MQTKAQKAWLVVLTLFFVVTAVRAVQLAVGPAAELATTPVSGPRTPARSLVQGTADIPQNASQAALEAELARLYASCPTGAVIGFDEVVKSPEQAAERLGVMPYPTTDRPATDENMAALLAQAAAAPVSPARREVPVVRYPRPVGPSGTFTEQTPAEQIASAPTPTDGVRIALNPYAQNRRLPSGGGGSSSTSPRVAASSDPRPAGDWLIDPDQWYTEQERQLAEPGEAADVPSVTLPAEERAPEAYSQPEPVTEDEAWDAPAMDLPSADEPRMPFTSPRLPDVEASADVVAEPLVEEEPVVPSYEADGPLIGPSPFGPQETQPWIAPPALPPSHEPATTIEPVTVEPPYESPTPAPHTTYTPDDVSPVETVPVETVPSESRPTTPVVDDSQLPLPDDAQYEQPADPLMSGDACDSCATDPHAELFAREKYPSARACAACHEEIYEQWSTSSHAYAAVSPMFHKFEQKLNDLSQGTVGYFCMRCHAPVATDMGFSRDHPMWNMPEVAREGVTCIACHRVVYRYGKSNGERRIEQGPIFAPVVGGLGGDGVAEAIHGRDHFKVKTSPDDDGPGQDIHVEGIYFDQIGRSEFCASCHQVAVHPGIKLEVVWEQYRASPAYKKGIQCQDCHMGRVPGKPEGYDIGAVAVIDGKTVNDHRRKSNHVFYGPGYSIAHPGVFPFNLKADRWNMKDWLAFDWRAGWGTDEFEDRVADGEEVVQFPAVWAEVDDRYDAREIINENIAKLEQKRHMRSEVMENGSHVEGPFFDSQLCRGKDLDFHYIMTNQNEGHNLLTASLGAQPQLWANVVLIGPDGQRLWETGYTDSYGDVADIHSEDVRHGRLPFDWQLFNLQTIFLITGAKGTDREFPLPVNVDFDQLPFLRPGVQPISVLNHPPFIRMEGRSLAPLGSRKIPYRVPGHLIQQPGRYRLSFRLRNRVEPMYFMRFVGATTEMQRAMNEGMIDVHPMSVEFYVQ